MFPADNRQNYCSSLLSSKMHINQFSIDDVKPEDHMQRRQKGGRWHCYDMGYRGFFYDGIMAKTSAEQEPHEAQ
eukprot:scaffold202338_cov34-Prasinocladus_malaysianus.AAC.2